MAPMTRKLAHALESRRTRVLAIGALLGLPALLVVPGAAPNSAASVQAGGSGRPAFSATEKISRTNLVNGVNDVVDKRTFSVTVGQTHDLRNRQEIDVAWKGAHPTGGLEADENSALAAYEEYPVVLMMCRGTAATITPKTCWTQTSDERVQVDTSPMVRNPNNAWPPYRLDRYGSIADRGQSVGVPNPVPKACGEASISAQYWVPFVAASGHVYHIGPQGCAGLPPEAANVQNELQPGNTTYGASDLQGNGSAKFVITTDETNASLGCSDKVACALAVIPIMGISCDSAGLSLPPADRPPSSVAAQAFAECSQTGAYRPGQQGFGVPSLSHLSVTGALWFSASNWRNRIIVPLTFAQPSNICQLSNSSAPVLIYGSYLLLQATEQWAPHFCLNPKLFLLQQVQTSEPEAKNLIQARSIDAAFEGSPPPTPFTNAVVQAPTALSGFAITYDIDSNNGQPYTHLRLDARLLAKLLTESYPENEAIRAGDHKPGQQGLSGNPLSIVNDPEFQALNPGVGTKAGELSPAGAAALLALSSSSDAMWALTSYINADPEARAWLNGKPDPWGMVVNPKYKGITLPVTTWPLLDTYVSPVLEGNNPCLRQDPVPWLPQVAFPQAAMQSITLDLQFGISNAQIFCQGEGTQGQQLASVGREPPGQQFIIGITSLADAERYQLNSAALETQGGSTSDAKFTTANGRSFAGPTNASLRAAAKLMEPVDSIGTWTMPYNKLRTDAAGKSAYPGTMLISTDVLTSGLSKPLARDYAKFLDFAATSGQRAGFGNGQVPPGYLPLTASNGMAKMAAYTKDAAAAVTAQKGQVPRVTSAHAPSSSSPSPSPSQSSPSPSSGGTSTSSSGSGHVSPSAPSSSLSPSGSPSIGLPTVSPGASPPALGTTAYTRSALSGVLLPIVLLIALVVGTAGFAVWQLRPTRPRS
jgi:hypothetical protein